MEFDTKPGLTSETLVFLLRKVNLWYLLHLSLPFPRPSLLIPSLSLSLLYPALYLSLFAFVIHPSIICIPHTFPFLTPFSTHHLALIISPILVLCVSSCLSFVLRVLPSSTTDDSSQGPFSSRVSTVSGPNHLGFLL